MDEWKNQLKNIFKSDSDLVEIRRRKESQASLDKRDAERFITNIAQPAFEEIKTEFTKYNKRIEITSETNCIVLDVFAASGYEEYTYKLVIEGRVPVVYTHSQLKDERFRLLSKAGNAILTIDELSGQYLAAHFVERYSHYKKYFR